MRNEPETGAPLIEAARQHDHATVERLLREGADANVEDARGRTALHYAVAAEDAEIAACVLAYGARHNLPDADGHVALDANAVPVEVLHAIRQHYHRCRRNGARPSPSVHRIEPWVAELDRRGIVKISGLLSLDELTSMRREFEQFVRALGRKIARGEAHKRHYFEEEHWWPEERAFVSNNAFKYSPQLVRFSCRPEVLEMAHWYLGHPPIIQRALAMRYLAGPNTDNDMFAWHHDLEDKRFKVMLLLSNVGPDDQHMSYVTGSHALFHPYRMFLENRCDLDYCRQHLGTLDIYDAIGDAGDVFLFDSNGAHRGIRRETGRVRDVFFVELNRSTANVWGGDVDPSLIADARLRHNPFARLMAADKKWDMSTTQQLPTWAESLRDVNAWLRSP